MRCYLKVWILFFLFSFSIAYRPVLLNAQSLPLCLTIRNLSDDRSLYNKPVRPGDTFVYSYTHSLQKLPIQEKFFISRDLNIVLIESKVKSLAASGPFPAPNEAIYLTKEYAFIKTKRCFKSLALRVAYYYKQQIIFPGEVIELNQIATPGDAIEIKIKRIYPESGN
jgi:hypothetical protein